ncbi:MAG: amidase [Sulfitobacter sp.]|nr:amidase [Sulfitobacter sp.]
MDPTTLSATEQSDTIAGGTLSAAELMQATLERIAVTNGSVNAIVSLRDPDDLITEARAADRAPRKGWLHGIPIAIKDLANAKGLPTSKGSPLFAGQIAAEDDLMVSRLKEQGALVIGKTNTPEFGLGSHTFNPVHGPTRNPYDLTKSAGGSSGGAGAALAARMLSVADGSDMMGSLRNPAAWNNVYGLRPTWGAVPSEPTGDIFMHQLSTLGPMARTPLDLARLLDTMAGPDSRQPHGLTPDAAAPQVKERGPRLRLGWLGDWGGALPFEPGLLDLSERALHQFGDMGHEVHPLGPPFDAEAMWESWITLRSFSVAAGLHEHFLEPKERDYLKPAARWEVERGIAMSAMELHAASMVRSDWFRRTTPLFEEVDVLVLPSAQCWPFDLSLTHPTEIAGVQMDTYHRWMQVVIPASLIGLPVVNLPIGFGENGLPAGLQIIAGRGGEGRLLQFANEWHQATDWPNRRPPEFTALVE